MAQNTAKTYARVIGEKPANLGLKDENLNRFLTLMAATNVKRYHTFPIIGEQTVGHHTLRILYILDYLTDRKVSVELMRAAMYHDAAEIMTGDIPATAKWDYPELGLALTKVEMTIEKSLGIRNVLTTEERLLLKTADMLDLIMFAKEQEQLGNKNATRLIKRGILYLGSLYPNGYPDGYTNKIKGVIS